MRERSSTLAVEVGARPSARLEGQTAWAKQAVPFERQAAPQEPRPRWPRWRIVSFFGTRMLAAGRPAAVISAHSITRLSARRAETSGDNNGRLRPALGQDWHSAESRSDGECAKHRLVAANLPVARLGRTAYIDRVTPAMTISFRSLFVVLASAWVVAMTSAVTATQGAVQPRPLRPLRELRTTRPIRHGGPRRLLRGVLRRHGRFDRAMALCETSSPPNPTTQKHWSGTAAASFPRRTGLPGRRLQKGGELWGRGMAEMSRAVSLQPENVGRPHSPRRPLTEASRQMPPAQAGPVLKLAVDDYEQVLALQASYFDRLSDHARGELLFGLADGWARLGNQEKARDYFMRLTSSASSSGRVTYAKAWLDGAPPSSPGRCVGCH